MKLLIRGHETTVLPRWRDHIYERVAKLDRFEDRIIRIEYFLHTDRHHLKGSENCHITVKVPRKSIDIKKNATTMIEAIDAASKVLERQIHSLYKDIKDRHRRARETRAVKRGYVTYTTGN